MTIKQELADSTPTKPLTMEMLRNLRKVLADSDAIMPTWKGLIFIDDGSEEYKNLIKEITNDIQGDCK